MYVRNTSGPLTNKEVLNLFEADLFAEKLEKKINTVITVHPKFLENSPIDLGRALPELTNKIRIYCHRRGFGYFAIWVRENYDGQNHEHAHILLHVPNCEHDELEIAVRRWLPGDERAVKFTRPQYNPKHLDRCGRPQNMALTYCLKQMTPQAWYALPKSTGLRVRREKHDRKTGAAVAPVLGKRCGLSRSLNAKARRSLLPTPKPARPVPSAPSLKAA